MNDTTHGYLRQTITALVALSLFLSVLGPVGTVAADPSVSVEQTADSTAVAPGETVTLTTTLAAEDVNGPLVELDFPDGWEGTVTDSDGGTVRPQDTSGNVLPSNSPAVLWLGAGTYEVTTELQVPEDAAPGDYTVSTTGSGVDPTDDDDLANEDDEIDSTETTITVQEPDQNENPSASFTASPSSPDAGETVSFDASGSSDTDGSIASYEWDFGDGETASGESPTHTYDTPGEYDVTLTVTDDDGATDTATQTVSVSEVPNQDPTASISGPSSAQVDEQVSFDASGSSDTDGSIASYEWEFGDGETATGASASHTYDIAGDYTVSVTVTDDDGAADTATQTVSVSEAAAPAEFQLSNLAVESPVTQGDASTVTATVENVGDEEGTQTVALDVDDSEVDTESVTLDGDASQQVSFDVDTTGLSVGDHDVSVSTDDDSASATLSVTDETPANQDPSAALDASPSAPDTGETVTFDASASTDADGSIASYEWEFGDGETASGESVTHAYDAAGDYDVTLTVTDDDGATDTATQTVSVSEPAEPEPGLSTGVSLSPSEELVGVNGTTTFDVMVENADGGVGTYTFTVSAADAGVASITELELADSADGAITDVQYASDNSSVTVEAVLVDTEDTGEVTLGTVVVEGDSEGETDVDLSVDLLGDEAGDAYEVTAENGATLTVSELVVGGSEQPAQDLDGDGVYEDVNGDGEINELDVQLLFTERNSGIVQGSPDAFDFNGDGEFDNLDIQKFYYEEVA